MIHKLYFDGACLPRNPGDTIYYGWLLKDEQGNTIDTGFGHVPMQSRMLTNNDAEYTALIKALQAAHERRVSHVRIYGDSQLVINQTNGRWQCNAYHLARKRDKALRLLNRLSWYELTWIRRDDNSEADRLSKKAYYETQ